MLNVNEVSLFVIILNDGLYNDNVMKKNIFNMDEIEGIFEKWSGNEEMKDDMGNIVNVVDLLEEKKEVYNINMVEMGDNYIEVGIRKIES